jgi:ABC-2 type transport system permease protein
MKNKKIFSPGLYFEGLRQTRLIGILSFIVITFAAVVSPIASVIITTAERHIYNYENSEIIKSSVDGLSMNPMLFFVFVLVAPIMVLTLFGFLNKRNTSDFWHSIPHTRLCLFVSFLMSIITWVAGIIAASSLISSAVYTIFGKYYIPMYGALAKYSFGCFIISLLIIGAVSFAMTITGTTLTNLVLSCLILFAPRLFYTTIDQSIANSLRILCAGHVLPLSGTGYNMLIDVINSVFSFNLTTVMHAFFNAGGLIYTSLLALIYTALAAIFFIKRKSEAASFSAPSRTLQAVYRCAVTMVVCLISISLIISYVDDYGSGILVICGAIYIIAIIVYFAYELITTRKPKNLLKAIPGLLIVVLLNAAFIGSGVIARTAALSFTPSADEIISVQLVNENEYYYGGREYSYIDYMTASVGNVKTDDSEVRKIISDSIAENVNDIKNDIIGSSYQDYTSAKVIIQTKSGRRYRNLRIETDDYQKINEKILFNDKFKEKFNTIPDHNGIFNISGISYCDFTDEELLQVYNSLKEEIATLSFDEWYDFLNDNAETNQIEFSFNTILNDNNAYIRIPISEKILPKTYSKILGYMSVKISGSIDALESKINDIISSIDEKAVLADEYHSYVEPSVCIYNSKSESYERLYFAFDIGKQYGDDATATDISKQLAEDIKGYISGDKLTVGDSYIIITVNSRYENADVYSGYYYESTYYLFNLKNSNYDELTKLMSKYTELAGYTDYNYVE